MGSSGGLGRRGGVRSGAVLRVSYTVFPVLFWRGISSKTPENTQCSCGKRTSLVRTAPADWPDGSSCCYFGVGGAASTQTSKALCAQRTPPGRNDARKSGSRTPIDAAPRHQARQVPPSILIGLPVHTVTRRQPMDEVSGDPERATMAPVEVRGGWAADLPGTSGPTPQRRPQREPGFFEQAIARDQFAGGLSIGSI